MSQTSATSSPVDEVIDFFVRAPSRAEIAAFGLSDAAQDHIRALLAKNAAGILTRDESRELDKITVLNDVVSLIRARARGAQNHDDPSQQAALSSTLPGA